jgi:RNA-directed DNA polymerase
MIIERMARELGLTAHYIENFARGASHAYKVYAISKRTGGTRTIHHPSRPLKALQRWFLAAVVDLLPMHPAATAYRKHRSILDNARPHAESGYLLRMDFTNFFPSITQADLAKYIAERPSWFSGWTPSDIDTFCGIVCRKSVLTIGAPTSPALSNALCYDMDSLIAALSIKNDVTYTRYADDLFFSTKQAGVLRPFEGDVRKVVADLTLPANLKVNPGKTRHSSKKRARRVTGIVIGSDGKTHVGRSLKRKIRALVYRLDSLDELARGSLAGMIAYVTGFEPDFINTLIAKYGLATVQRAISASTASR